MFDRLLPWIPLTLVAGAFGCTRAPSGVAPQETLAAPINMVLDEQGKNIDSISPWPQNSAVVVERLARRAIYTPMYWATKHYSGLIDVGARLVHSDGAYNDQIAFVNPDGSAVVELLNVEKASAKVIVAVGTRSFAVELPAESFATLIVPKS
jgi:hypothetical protein